jgi:hypothetical protein
MLFLASYLVEQSISESRIAKSEDSATKAYYVAEAGVNEAIYKLKKIQSGKMLPKVFIMPHGMLDPYYMCGPGDPDGFLYRGKRRPDGASGGRPPASVP